MTALHADIGHNRPLRTKEDEDRLFEIERDEHLPVACERIPVAKAMRMTPRCDWQRWLGALEQNQLIASCCRHPEEHDIEAWYSTPEERAKGTPDIYVFYCNECNRRHRRLCVGGSDAERGRRPFWKIR